MLAVILTGHGRFASGLKQAAEQIVGQQPQFWAVDFPEGKSSQQLEQELQQAINECETSSGLIFLTDILGGSPFRSAALLSMTQPHCEVITGTNLQLVIEMLLERETLNTVEFRQQALECGQRGLTSLWHQQQKPSTQHEDDNGI